MRTYSVCHLSDRELLRELVMLVAQDRNTTAKMLAHLAEVDARKLYLPAGYPSMFAYCVEELRLSEDAAKKRIHAARTARKFSAIFDAVTDGRLHLSAVVMLSPYLIRENADSLIAGAAGKTKSEIELVLAQRFPRTELLPMVEAIPASALAERAPGHVGLSQPAPVAAGTTQGAPGHVGLSRPAPGAAASAQGAPGHLAGQHKATPIGPERYALHLTMDEETHEMLRHAQALLGHRVPSGDLAEVLKRALQALIPQLEKQKFAATERPRRSQPTKSKRHIPARVKRAVWERDRGRCTFVGANGHRCDVRRLLEYDHIDPVARGGTATIEGVRLRCRAHNQFEAERVFGAGFMSARREAARACAVGAGDAA